MAFSHILASRSWSPIFSRSKTKPYKCQEYKILSLNSRTQTYQILTNDDEVCIPRLYCILIAVRSNAAFSNWVPLHRRSPKSSSVCVVHFIFEDVKWSIFSLARIHSIFVDLNKKEYLFCLLGFENTGRMYQKNMTCFHHTCCKRW